MHEIPSRDLRNQVSAVLRRVEETGQTLTVTVNGRPVARLGPFPQRPDSMPWQVFWEALARVRADPSLAEELAQALPDSTDRVG
ncbi:MAG: type II toxin-antitoxin system Phd/YefM family antitoxin [Acidimicrobiia bacterium]